METIQPFLKYILYAISILGFLWVNKIFITNPELRKWLMQSFEDENGRTSGKAFSAFTCTSAVVIGYFIAVHYGENHTAPEYYFWGMIGLVTSLYGIKEVGKVMTTYSANKYSNGNGNGNGHGNGAEPAPQPKLDDASLKKKWEEAETDLSFEEWVKTQK